MSKNFTADIQKMGVLFEVDRRISAEYSCASSLLQEEEVARKFKFLGALDRLAHNNDYSARDVIEMLKPGYLDSAREEGASEQTKELHDKLVGHRDKTEP